jgi:cellulose synthase/poly-beta-1,6-N-acetylglucosamine synthase-like glycosyltransferase
MKISVIIPTYRRPVDLDRCMAALARQSHAADEVVVVRRDEDQPSIDVILKWTETLSFLREVGVAKPGQVAALNAGLDAIQSDIIAITDDDAAPRPDWLARIHAHFLSGTDVGGVGGRDWVHEHGAMLTGKRFKVGRVQWFGRPIGDHHLGAGDVQDVDILKGANMSYRRVAIEGLRFDERLLGRGAQVANDMAFSLAVKNRGWRLVYDPQVAVDHFPAKRADEDQRNQFNEEALENAVHNETLALLDYLPTYRRLIFGFWAIVVGTRAAPGLLQGVRLRLQGHTNAWAKTRSALRGRKAAYQVWQKS